MAQVTAGRSTHQHEGDLAVFLIGMRFNRLRRPDQWWPVFTAMPRMVAELHRNRIAAARGEAEDLGFRGARTMLDGAGITVVQYWRSVDDIYRYASATDLEHRPAWSAFNVRARRAGGAVGIWHETFAVPAGAHESVYVDCEPRGLAAATTLVPLRTRTRPARLRATAQ